MESLLTVNPCASVSTVVTLENALLVRLDVVKITNKIRDKIRENRKRKKGEHDRLGAKVRRCCNYKYFITVLTLSPKGSQLYFPTVIIPTEGVRGEGVGLP